MTEEVQKKNSQEFPCSNCGAKLEFKPGVHALTCPYCDNVTDIPQSEEDIIEVDYAKRLHELADAEETIEIENVSCSSCSAKVEVPEGITSFECPYCCTAIVIQTTSESIIKPKSLLPFKVTREEGRDAYKKWLSSLWFAPSSLKTYASMDGKLQGVYTPYWTYDSNTVSFYHGERGVNYTEWKTRTVTRNGKSVSERYSVTKTRWHRVSGTVFCSFDDILILASHSLPRKYTEKLEPWDLPNLVPYSHDYLAGFSCERYQVDLEKGFDEAKDIMESPIRNQVRYDIGGDKQRIHSVKTQYNNITFKHILLPIWVCAYRYKNKTYRFLINGRTGEVQGERPWSWVKIALAILFVIAIIATIVILVQE